MTQCRVTPYADPGEVYPRRRVGGFFVAGHGVDARTSASASVAAGYLLRCLQSGDDGPQIGVLGHALGKGGQNT